MTSGEDTVQESMQRCLQKAADDLAVKLKHLATRLAATTTPRRIPYGRARFGFLRPRSPRGFVISHHDLEVLLPDGRIWAEGLPGPDGRTSGRYIHIDRTAGSRMRVAGRTFAFLGLSVGGYSFGVADHPRGADCRLCAMVTTGRGISLIDADAALEAIAHKAAGHD